MIDELDRKLIVELQENGRKGYVALAKKMGVVEGTVRKRIKNLLEKSLVKIVAVPNMRKLGYGFIGLVGIQVKLEDLRKVADTLAKNEHICYLAFVTGRYDLMAIVATQSPEELSQFIEREISAVPSILRTETFVNLETIKGGSGLMDTLELVHRLEVSR